MRDVLSDPVYKTGVDPDSIIDMITDIKYVYTGERDYVRIPRPRDGIAPFESMKFKAPPSVHPDALEFTPKRKTTVLHPSRRRMSYSLSSPSSTPTSTEPEETIPRASKRGGGIEDIISTIEAHTKDTKAYDNEASGDTEVPTESTRARRPRIRNMNIISKTDDASEGKGPSKRNDDVILGRPATRVTRQT